MAIENITYNTIIEEVAGYIVSNCYNINSTLFNTLPNYFLSPNIQTNPFKNVLLYTGDNPSGYTSHCYVSVNSNYLELASISSDTMQSYIRDYLGDTFGNLNSYITPGNFIGFFNSIISFCSQFLRFSTSQFDSRTFLIWIGRASGESYPAKYPGKNDDIIYADQMNDIMKVLKNRISITVRARPVKYKFTFD